MTTDRPCPVLLPDGACGRPLASGAEACGACLTNARLDLLALVTTPATPEDDARLGLLDELDVAITRQSRMTSTGGSNGCPEGCGHWPESPFCVAGTPVVFDVRASNARAALVDALDRYAHQWARDHPIADVVEGPYCRIASFLIVTPCVHDSCLRIRFTREAWHGRAAQLGTPDMQARTLAGRVESLAGHPWIADLATDLAADVREANAACDRPPDQRVAGRCGVCGAAVYAADGATVTTCRACGARWDVQALRDASLATAEVRLTKPQIAAVLGMPVGTLHRWSSERRITSTGYNAAGQPLYVLAPIAAHVRGGTTPPIPKGDT